MNVQLAGLLSLMYDIFRFSAVDSGLLCSFSVVCSLKENGGFVICIFSPISVDFIPCLRDGCRRFGCVGSGLFD